MLCLYLWTVCTQSLVKRSRHLFFFFFFAGAASSTQSSSRMSESERGPADARERATSRCRADDFEVLPTEQDKHLVPRLYRPRAGAPGVSPLCPSLSRPAVATACPPPTALAARRHRHSCLLPPTSRSISIVVWGPGGSLHTRGHRLTPPKNPKKFNPLVSSRSLHESKELQTLIFYM